MAHFLLNLIAGHPYPERAALALAFALQADAAVRTIGYRLADAQAQTGTLHKVV